MATIHLIGGEKGGVGKSVVARLLAQYLIDNKIPFTGFDTDRSHGALMRYYSGYASPTIIDSYQSLDAIVEAAASDPDKHILVDLAAQTFHPLARWIDESGVLELANEMGITVNYWNVMDSGKDSVDLLGRLLEKYGTRLHYIIVLNQLRDDNFSILEESGIKERAVAAGARFITLKKLHAPVMTKIDSNSYSFWAARNKDAENANGLGLLERQRAKLWLDHAYKEFASLELDGIPVLKK
ncbi:MAG: mobilization protein [Pseudomonadota bacterium]